jgi:hypothetical protein
MSDTDNIQDSLQNSVHAIPNETDTVRLIRDFDHPHPDQIPLHLDQNQHSGYYNGQDSDQIPDTQPDIYDEDSQNYMDNNCEDEDGSIEQPYENDESENPETPNLKNQDDNSIIEITAEQQLAESS